MNKLFYDTAITGHHPEYISHLVDYLSLQVDQKDQYIFVVHPKFHLVCSDIYEKGNKISHFQWEQITESDHEFISKKSLTSYLKHFNVMRKYAEKLKADHVFLLDFNPMQFGAMMYRTSFTMSGILFSPFYRLQRKSLREKMVYVKRYCLSKFNSINPKIKNIFILNDSETVTKMNEIFHKEVFKMLPDPIPNLEPLEDFDIYSHYGIDKDRSIFLHIGSLGNRKGSYEVIASAGCIDKNIQKKVCILLVGKAGTPAEKSRLQSAMESVKDSNDAKIIWDEQFVSISMMKSLFDQSYAVLIPYKNVEFSSGILGHAAAANKIVIATGAGLIKQLVDANNLGILIDGPYPDTIAKAINKSLDADNKIQPKADFINNRRPEIFSEIIIEN